MSRASLALLLLGAGPVWAQKTVAPIVEVPVTLAVPLAGAAILPQNILTSQALGPTLALPHALPAVLRAKRASVAKPKDRALRPIERMGEKEFNARVDRLRRKIRESPE